MLIFTQFQLNHLLTYKIKEIEISFALLRERSYVSKFRHLINLCTKRAFSDISDYR